MVFILHFNTRKLPLRHAWSVGHPLLINHYMCIKVDRYHAWYPILVELYNYIISYNYRLYICRDINIEGLKNFP